MHLSLLLSSPLFRFPILPHGFGAVELGFKGGQPWEGKGKRKNVRTRGRVGQEEGAVGVGGGGLDGPFSPSNVFLFLLQL